MRNKEELLKKIKALAEQGVGGEQSNAQSLLEKLMQKYNVTEEELDEEEVRRYDIYFKGYYERRILGQIAYKVTNSVENISRLRWTYSGRLIRNQLAIECTPSQYVEITYLFDFYKNLWYEEVDNLLSAYIVKHKLFGAHREDVASIDSSDFNIAMLVNGLQDKSPLRAIEAPDED